MKQKKSNKNNQLVNKFSNMFGMFSNYSFNYSYYRRLKFVQQTIRRLFETREMKKVKYVEKWYRLSYSILKYNKQEGINPAMD